MEKTENAAIKIIAIGFYISALILVISCNLIKKEEWTKVKGVIFIDGKQIKEISMSGDNRVNGHGMSLDEYLWKYGDKKYTEPLINIKYLKDNTKIFKAKFREDGELYLVSKNPDYKMGGVTSKFSHVITIEANKNVYLQLDL